MSFGVLCTPARRRADGLADDARSRQRCIQKCHIIPAMKEICRPPLTAAANLLVRIINLCVFSIKEELGSAPWHLICQAEPKGLKCRARRCSNVINMLCFFLSFKTYFTLFNFHCCWCVSPFCSARYKNMTLETNRPVTYIPEVLHLMPAG